ncbi:MAG: hypothetical protein O3B64_00305 [bacterium]|nr:hypothetical protein [bacterium]MDA1024403.1 hypothetical protein [bacterium]
MRSDTRGAAATVGIVVLTALVLVVTSSLVFLTIGSIELGEGTRASGHAIGAAESCVHEAMLRISRDTSYSGGAISVGNADCTIVISATPCSSSCTITVESDNNGYVRNASAAISVSGSSVDITSWSEID